MRKPFCNVAILTLLMLCLVCAAANAAEKMPKGMAKDLNLTPDQKKQMQTIFERQREDEKKDLKSIRALQTALDEELIKDRPDESKIKSTVNEIKQIQIKLLDKHFDSTFALRKILTPEQFRKFIEKGRKMRDKIKGDRKGFRPKHSSTEEGFMPPPSPKKDI